MSYLLGVDNGLTMTKAVVFDAAGRPCGHGVLRSHQDHPRPGWVEKDPDVQWRGDLQGDRPGARGGRGRGRRRRSRRADRSWRVGLYTMDSLRGRGRPTRPHVAGRPRQRDRRPSRRVTASPTGAVADRSARHRSGSSRTSRAGPLGEGARTPDVYHRAPGCSSCKGWLTHKLTARVSTGPRPRQSPASRPWTAAQRHRGVLLAAACRGRCVESCHGSSVGRGRRDEC